MKRLTIITGRRNSGKTTLLKEVIKRIPNVLGVIAEKCLSAEGEIIGYDAVVFPVGKRMPLCRLYFSLSFTERQGKFWFDNSVFNYVNNYIITNYKNGVPVIIDEIGLLEINRQRGYYPALMALFQYTNLNLIITLRSMKKV